jgi:putative chitinase
MITRDQLKAIMPLSKNIDVFLEPLNQALEKYEINTPKRIACFLAQLAHESGSLKWVKELATGEAYEGRKDLGNIYVGDGVKFKGRGLIQITGRANYQSLGKYLGVDLIANPELLEQPLYAALSAGWFWSTKKLNQLADVMDFEKITKRINGGLNGYTDRLKYLENAKNALSVYMEPK